MRSTRPAVPGVSLSIRLPITARVISAAVWVPTATRRPERSNHGWPMRKLKRRPVRRKASKRSPTCWS
jgi:hypothetical protein